MSGICGIAGKRIEGGVGKLKARNQAQVTDAMLSSTTVDVPTLRAAAKEVLSPSNTAAQNVKEVAERLQVFGKQLPGTPVHMKLERRHAIAVINSGVLQPAYNFFLTYGANDRYWPEIKIMTDARELRTARAASVNAGLVHPSSMGPTYLPENIVALSVIELVALIVAIAPNENVESLKDKLDAYFCLCKLCNHSIISQTSVLSKKMLKDQIEKLKASWRNQRREHNDDYEQVGDEEFRSSGENHELQKRLTLLMRPALPPPLPREESLKMLAENPLIASLHYFDRERALWENILNGKRKPLSTARSKLLRHDSLQRASFHTHCLVGSEPMPGDPSDEYASVDEVCAQYERVATTEFDDHDSTHFDDFGDELPLSEKLRRRQETVDDSGVALSVSEIEKKRSTPEAAAAAARFKMVLDAQRRPKVPYLRHASHNRPRLVMRSHPAYRARSKAQKAGLQMHRCMKYCYKYDGVCRARFPRRLHLGKARFCCRVEGVKGGRKRAYVELRRNHPWINGTNECIQYAWDGNVDLQRIVEAKGSSAYVLAAAYYTTNPTKPENDALTKRMKASLSRLSPNSSVGQRLTKVANVMLNSIQRPIQQQWCTLLGQHMFPIVESTHKCIDVVVTPQAMQTRVLDESALLEANDDDDITVATVLSCKRKLVECYMMRWQASDEDLRKLTFVKPFEGLNDLGWENLSFGDFASNFFLVSVKVKSSIRMGQYNVSQHSQPVALSAIPFITADENDEQSAYGILFLWYPFQKEADLLTLPNDLGTELEGRASAVSVLKICKETNLLSTRAARVLK